MGANTGVQIKVWLPEEIYSIIRELAAATTEGNVSEVVRSLIADGLQKDAQQQAAQESVKSVTSALNHLERLTYFIAENTAFSVAATETSAQSQAQRQHADNPEEAAQALATAIGKLQGIAHERIRKTLRGPKPKLTEKEAD